MPTLAPDTLFRCPECHGALDTEPGGYSCAGGHSYPEVEGVVDLVPPALRDETWALWEDHLGAFQRRREARVVNPNSVSARVTGRSAQNHEFMRFVDPAGSTWLDIGCGPGKLSQIVPSGTRYVGVDPIPLLPDVLEVEFARAVSERLPFEDGAFSDVVVLHAIDHVKDVEASLHEIHRVLRADGRLHILQNSVERRHVLRYLAHEIKDFIEDRRDSGRSGDTPHHMTEFTAASLKEALQPRFAVVGERYWAPDPLSPKRFMVTAMRR